MPNRSAGEPAFEKAVSDADRLGWRRAAARIRPVNAGQNSNRPEAATLSCRLMAQQGCAPCAFEIVCYRRPAFLSMPPSMKYVLPVT
jgi:hypothetical protein